MRLRIGFFVSDEYNDGLTGDSLSDIILLRYKDAGHLRELWESHKAGLQMALFDSEAAARALSLTEQAPVMWEVAVPQEADLLRVLLVLLEEGGGVDLSRILVDIGDAQSLDGLFGAARRPVFISRDMWSKGALDDDWESQTLRRYQTAWESGCYDIILTRYLTLLPRLEALGITACGVPLGAGSVGAAVERLSAQMRERMWFETLPAFGMVGTRGGTEALEPLYGALEQFNLEQGRSFLLTRRSGTVELGTSNRVLRLLTNGYRSCGLLEFLKYQLPDAVCIGWGVGQDMVRARANAIRAYRESLFDRRHRSFLVDHEGALLGPLTGQYGVSPEDGRRPPELTEAAAKTGLSVSTLRRVAGLIESSGDGVLDSERLAYALGVTRRSAVRLLSALHSGGYAQTAGDVRVGGRGRPAKRYRVRLD